MKLIFKIAIYSLIGLMTFVCAGYAIVYLHKDEILAAINKEFNEKINGELSVEEMDFSFFENFPDFSFTLVRPLVKDSLYATHRQPLFKADKVFLKFSLLKLLNQE